ncbi:MAG: SDR family NAD(P)-dependent oxidoreductase [Chloroflexota bacterium]
MKQTVIITGGNSGLGYQCALTLAQQKTWHIVIASRNPKRVAKAVERLKRESGHTDIEGGALDLGSFDSIRSFANSWPQKERPPLTALICNAGLSPAKNSQTVDGIDTIFGVNHLGHYLLIHLMSQYLKEKGRLVLVSSGTHIPEHKLARRMQVPVPKYVNARDLAYPDQALEAIRIDSPPQRYSTSKLCNVLAAYEFARQFEEAGMEIGVYALDPGLMPGTGLARDFPAALRQIFFGLIGFAGRWVDGIRFPETSGEHLARLVNDPALSSRSALYFDGLNEARSSADSYDRDKAADLWNTSSALCQLDPSETRLAITI